MTKSVVDRRFSDKMKIMAFLAMISVAIIHSMAVETCGDSVSRINFLFRHFVCRSLTDWAVPFFYAASGFWFGRSGYVNGKMDTLSFYGKKARTLLLPYFCWALIGLAITLPLIVGNNFLAGKGLLSRTFVEVPGAWGKVDAILGISTSSPIGNVPLWYLRSLLVLFVFAPVWRWLIRSRIGLVVLIIFAGNQYFGYPLSADWYFHVIPGASCWFAIGLIVSWFQVENVRVCGWFGIGCALIWVIASAVAVVGNGELLLVPRAIIYGLSRMLVPAAIVFLWWLCGVACNRIGKLPWIIGQTFWIYCFHETVCQYIMSGGRYLLGKNDVSTLFLMFVTPCMAMAICLLAAVVVRRVSPRVYGFLTGGRA